MVRPARKRLSGFTVVELMIALVIIGIIAATIAPALGEVQADNRQTSAAMDIVRLARQTRAKAIATGIAHLLRYRNSNNAAGAFELGRVDTHVGLNSKCRQTPWQQSFTPAVGSGQRRMNAFTMADYNPTDGVTIPTAADAGRHVITAVARLGTTALPTLEDSDPAGQVLICYQPNGEIYTATAFVNQGSLEIQNQPVLITIPRSIDGVSRGRDRQVLFPVGGNARLR